MGMFLDKMRADHRARNQQEFNDYVFGASDTNSAAGTPPVERKIVRDELAYRQPPQTQAPDTVEDNSAGQFVNTMRGQMADMDRQAGKDFVADMLSQGLSSMEIINKAPEVGISRDSVLRALQATAPPARPPLPERDELYYRQPPNPVMSPPPATIMHDATVARFRRASAGGDVYGPTRESVMEDAPADMSVPEGESRMLPRAYSDRESYYARLKNRDVYRPAAPVSPVNAPMMPRRPVMMSRAMPESTNAHPNVPLGALTAAPLRELAVAASRPTDYVENRYPERLPMSNWTLDTPVLTRPDMNRRRIGRGPDIYGYGR